MKKKGLIILHALIIVMLLLLTNDLRKDLTRQEVENDFTSRRMLQQDELNNLLKSDILTHQNQIAQLEVDKLLLSDQIEVLKSEIVFDGHIFSSIMNYVFEDNNVPKFETFDRTLFVDSTQLETSRDEQYKVIKQDSILRLSPSPVSIAVKRIDYNYLVRVLEKSRIEHGDYESEWYYVELMYMDTKTDVRGWILVKSAEDYTLDSQKSIVNIRTKKDAMTYNTPVFDDIEDTPGIVNFLSRNARIISRKEGYVLLFGTDETYFWVLEEDIDFLEIYD